MNAVNDEIKPSRKDQEITVPEGGSVGTLKRAKKGRRGRPFSSFCTRSLLKECGECKYFLLTHYSSRKGNAWGRCRKFRTTVGKRGKACEEFSPRVGELHAAEKARLN
ncbi:MAG: hypothetical protein ACP5KV_07625, partial [Candidatus Methanomethylicaceae archaeon]